MQKLNHGIIVGIEKGRKKIHMEIGKEKSFKKIRVQ